MEQNLVTNTSSEDVTVMWDGINHYFEAGETKVFSGNVARALVNENEALTLETTEDHMLKGKNTKKAAKAEPEEKELDAETDDEGEPEEVDLAKEVEGDSDEEDAEDAVAGEDEFTDADGNVYGTRTTVKGQVQYLKNGKMIKKVDWEAAVNADKE